MSWLFPSLPNTVDAIGLRSPVSRSTTLLVVLAAHAAVLLLLALWVPKEALTKQLRALDVRLIEIATPPPPPPPPPKRQPVAVPKTAPPPIVAIVVPAPANVAPIFTVPPQPAPPPVLPPLSAPPPPSPVAVPPAPTFAAPVFNAAYLNNPAPAYPQASRRLGEEGRVVLRVAVDTAGLAAEVSINTSSGFPRLDAAARDAVLQWHFEPARRGDEAVAARVLVPIVFSLES